MKYEICKVIKDGDTDLYTAIAWTDVLQYAKTIVANMNALEADRYVVLENGSSDCIITTTLLEGGVSDG